MNYRLNDFYRGKEWVLLRQDLMDKRTNADGDIICAYCGKPIVKQYDCIGHHTVLLTESNVNDAMVSLNPELIQLVHHKCHNYIHNKLGYVAKQIYVVYGSPLSGKSTWVRNNIMQGDLVVDIDSIWQAISGCDRYIKPNKLSMNMFAVRDCLIEQIKYRVGRWDNAYVIGGYPLIGERERLIKTLDAKEIFIDTTKEECINRLKACSDRDFKQWNEYIEEWWRKYTPPTIA